MKRSTSQVRRKPVRSAGFGLIDALVALTLLAITLLGACGCLHFALRATRSAAWQVRAVDLVADLDEDLLQDGISLPLAARIESWGARLQQDLPKAGITATNPRRLVVDGLPTQWIELGLGWNGSPGEPRQTLQLPLAHVAAP